MVHIATIYALVQMFQHVYHFLRLPNHSIYIKYLDQLLLGSESALSNEKKTTRLSEQYTNSKQRNTLTKKAGAGSLTFSAKALSKLQVRG